MRPRGPAGPRPRAGLALLALALVLLCAAGAAAHGGGKKKAAAAKAPPTMNPYADQPYAGCEGGYCAAADPALEAALYAAVASGDAAGVRKLLGAKDLNTSRNIVPDEQGFVRVKDVAVWVAAKKGQLKVMEVRAQPASGRRARRRAGAGGRARQAKRAGGRQLSGSCAPPRLAPAAAAARRCALTPRTYPMRLYRFVMLLNTPLPALVQLRPWPLPPAPLPPSCCWMRGMTPTMRRVTSSTWQVRVCVCVSTLAYSLRLCDFGGCVFKLAASEAGASSGAPNPAAPRASPCPQPPTATPRCSTCCSSAASPSAPARSPLRPRTRTQT